VIAFETKGRAAGTATVQSMKRALEAAGVEFIAENGSGAGVVFRKRNIELRLWHSGRRIMHGLLRPQASSLRTATGGRSSGRRGKCHRKARVKAARVASVMDIHDDLSQRWQALAALHSAPRWLWPALVGILVAEEWTVERARKKLKFGLNRALTPA
jgi:hypothetical protein